MHGYLKLDEYFVAKRKSALREKKIRVLRSTEAGLKQGPIASVAWLFVLSDWNTFGSRKPKSCFFIIIKTHWSEITQSETIKWFERNHPNSFDNIQMYIMYMSKKLNLLILACERNRKLSNRLLLLWLRPWITYIWYTYQSKSMGVVVFIQVRASRGTRPTVTCNSTEGISREQLGILCFYQIWTYRRKPRSSPIFRR